MALIVAAAFAAGKGEMPHGDRRWANLLQKLLHRRRLGTEGDGLLRGFLVFVHSSIFA